jgi:hypothetical protein
MFDYEIAYCFPHEQMCGGELTAATPSLLLSLDRYGYAVHKRRLSHGGFLDANTMVVESTA